MTSSHHTVVLYAASPQAHVIFIGVVHSARTAHTVRILQGEIGEFWANSNILACTYYPPTTPYFTPAPPPKPPNAPDCNLDTTSQHSEKHVHIARVGTSSHKVHMGWVAAIMPS